MIAALTITFCIYICVGSIVLNKYTKEIAEYSVWVNENSSGFWFSLAEILWITLIWPTAWIFYSSEECRKKIATAKHTLHPWAFDEEGKEYGEAEKLKRLREQAQEKLYGKRRANRDTPTRDS